MENGQVRSSHYLWLPLPCPSRYTDFPGPLVVWGGLTHLHPLPWFPPISLTPFPLTSLSHLFSLPPFLMSPFLFSLTLPRHFPPSYVPSLSTILPTRASLHTPCWPPAITITPPQQSLLTLQSPPYSALPVALDVVCKGTALLPYSFPFSSSEFLSSLFSSVPSFPFVSSPHAASCLFCYSAFRT